MPQYEIYLGWKIIFYTNDHSPIHFHAIKGGANLRVTICDYNNQPLSKAKIEVLNGKCSPTEFRTLTQYAKTNISTLMEVWYVSRIK